MTITIKKQTRTRCPKGTRKNKKTGNCDKAKSKTQKASLIDKINTALSAFNKLNILDDVQPPKKALLKLTQVKKLKKQKNGSSILVVSPQSYSKVETLTPDKLDENSDDYIHFSFSEPEKNIAVTGGGSDRWWLAEQTLLDWLTTKIHENKNKHTSSSSSLTSQRVPTEIDVAFNISMDNIQQNAQKALTIDQYNVINFHIEEIQKLWRTYNLYNSINIGI